MKKIILNQKASIALFGFLTAIFLTALIYALTSSAKDDNVLTKLFLTLLTLLFMYHTCNQFDSGKKLLEKLKKLYELLDK